MVGEIVPACDRSTSLRYITAVMSLVTLAQRNNVQGEVPGMRLGRPRSLRI